ncbi:hypothetical protein EYZ11_001855 [Aspergillus tanneri]|uniref:Uncharacterized protein n=1 Tax=Aspergillus tanneri TaxID=1220188 RepID=A0A4S3JSB0_9EURO|nr:uncharacterized protein ATNIH1004_003624 [Aspergillus tanneri]KAA8650934.1 hypothetical protein ATNIH1004_003624 [Aspergillus tanneri]THC98652.1 hypothetical protein EYZ11_001855 [Aspergillus tanneri]
MSNFTGNKLNYNEILSQISVNLNNALNTFGPSSSQYQAILEILKDNLQNIDRHRDYDVPELDPDTLSLALGFLEIGNKAS